MKKAEERASYLISRAAGVRAQFERNRSQRADEAGRELHEEMQAMAREKAEAIVDALDQLGSYVAEVLVKVDESNRLRAEIRHRWLELRKGIDGAELPEGLMRFHFGGRPSGAFAPELPETATVNLLLAAVGEALAEAGLQPTSLPRDEAEHLRQITQPAFQYGLRQLRARASR